LFFNNVVPSPKNKKIKIKKKERRRRLADTLNLLLYYFKIRYNKHKQTRDIYGDYF
jgi:hypothetical protein